MSERPYEVTTKPGGAPVKSWTRGVPFEAKAREQVERIAAMPFIHRHVAIMPDVHLGIGATVGSVIATRGAVIPAAVGVDIGCGMMAAKTSLRAEDLPDSLAPLRSTIEAAVPVGRAGHGAKIPETPMMAFIGLAARPAFGFISDTVDVARAPEQLGTLGGGNHFIELCLDETGAVWVMLHSGSRGIGNKIGVHYIEKAREEMRRWFINLPDRDLAYIPEGSDLFAEYVDAVEWAQDYAAANRRAMLEAVLGAMRTEGLPSFTIEGGVVSCHHNYISREHHFGENCIVTRKGAVRAREGDLGIIPGSMGAKSFIVRGKGNAESFHSCSHGAGRVMSRTEAKKRITQADHEAATAGVECRKDSEVIDESPAAYKDVDAVMAAQADLVEIVATLKQVLCVKG